MAICYLGIGSNLGDRRKNIRLAIGKIKALRNTTVVKSSRIVETSPLGGPPGQEKFLNAVLKVDTDITPINLLKRMKQIERDLGRKKTVRFGPRTIDLDMLFYADRIIDTKQLKVPHPRMFERDFVVGPLLEVI
jgi:2-amino-4-hydroxy-6-hydroxymethyldihydropteridine diphosphokinase